MTNPYRDQQQAQAYYLRQQIESASPAQQLVLLYDGAIKFTLVARDAITRGDIQGRHNANRRAMEIVSYLLEILDVDKGGEVAARLNRIYSHLLKRFLDVDFSNSIGVCDEILDHLRTLRASWDQLAKQGVSSAQAPQQAPSAAAPQPSGGQVVASPVTAATAVPGRRGAVA